MDKTQYFQDMIKNSYEKLLKREPDKPGFDNYLHLLQNHEINEFQLSELIKSSPEFLASHPEIIPNVIFPEKLENVPEPKIVATFRIKNEERWIEKSLKAASEICQEIVVLDDGSTDNTLKICKKFPKVVDIHNQANLPHDDVRDKNILLKMALKLEPDFLLVMNGDEVIMPNMKQILKEDLCVLYPQTDVFHVKYLEMRDKPNQFRTNDTTTTNFHASILRMKNQPNDLLYEEMNFPGNLHCPLIPQNAIGQDNIVKSRFKILHYGAYDEKSRQKRYQFLTKLDPNNTDFFGYEHIIHPEKFCGPLQYAFLPKGSYIESIK